MYVSTLDTDEPAECAFAFAPIVPAQGTGGLSGERRVWAEADTKGDTLLTVEETRFDVPWRRRLEWHLADEFNDRMDSLEAFIQGRTDQSSFAQQFIRA